MGALRLTRDGVVVASAVVTREPTGRVIPLAPGQSLATAYGQASAGDTIELAGGNYGTQSVPTGTKAVTVRARAGETPWFVDLSFRASNCVVRGLRCRELGATDFVNTTFEDCVLDGDGMADPVLPLYLARTTGAKFRRCSFGNVVTAKNILLDIRVDDVLFEDCVIHDVYTLNDTFHNEGMYVNHTRGLVMRRCRFERVATMDCFITHGGTGQIGKDFRFEDCEFGATHKKGAPGTVLEPHVQSLSIHRALGQLDGLVLLRNHFAVGINATGFAAPAINSWARGNTGDMGQPIQGMVYEA